jgi:hypothetical protein
LTLDLRFVPDAELPVYFGAADIAVVPFRRSLTSGSVALAATYGLPVVAPRLPSVTAITGAEAPFLYDPSMADGLRTALRRSLTDATASARPRVPMTWEQIAMLHVSVYNRSAPFPLPALAAA